MGFDSDENGEVAPMGALRPWHIAVLVVVLVLLFGAKRLPDAARSLGRSLRIIKAETRGLADDDVSAKAEAQAGHRPLTQVEEERASARPTVDPVERVREN
jgi:sec-independent protein translocase protein TatA